MFYLWFPPARPPTLLRRTDKYDYCHTRALSNANTLLRAQIPLYGGKEEYDDDDDEVLTTQMPFFRDDLFTGSAIPRPAPTGGREHCKTKNTHTHTEIAYRVHWKTKNKSPATATTTPRRVDDKGKSMNNNINIYMEREREKIIKKYSSQQIHGKRN